ncbi:UNVERIFIED_CONTAM: hypothetical protein Slati_2431200 [Sesamum latifolium]|uniref:Uncharacterized protein n=1 Tax=Sesamum latifolium TaxID=2727402 RepID=A0AAW2WCA7_9LAMI
MRDSNLDSKVNRRRTKREATLIAVLRKKTKKRIWAFLWAGGGQRYIAKVAWDNLRQSIAAGGLGISPVTEVNKALKCRYIWEIVSDNGSSIWIQWIHTGVAARIPLWNAAIVLGEECPTPSSNPGWHVVLASVITGCGLRVTANDTAYSR